MSKFKEQIKDLENLVEAVDGRLAELASEVASDHSRTVNDAVHLEDRIKVLENHAISRYRVDNLEKQMKDYSPDLPDRVLILERTTPSTAQLNELEREVKREVNAILQRLGGLEGDSVLDHKSQDGAFSSFQKTLNSFQRQLNDLEKRTQVVSNLDITLPARVKTLEKNSASRSSLSALDNGVSNRLDSHVAEITRQKELLDHFVERTHDMEVEFRKRIDDLCTRMTCINDLRVKHSQQISELERRVEEKPLDLVVPEEWGNQVKELTKRVEELDNSRKALEDTTNVWVRDVGERIDKFAIRLAGAEGEHEGRRYAIERGWEDVRNLTKRVNGLEETVRRYGEQICTINSELASQKIEEKDNTSTEYHQPTWLAHVRFTTLPGCGFESARKSLMAALRYEFAEYQILELQLVVR